MTAAHIHRSRYGGSQSATYDAIVVGARVAGAATAMLLARAGLDVLVVLDRAHPGADTLSTHALMRGGVLQLRRWGLLDTIVDAGTPPIRRTVIHYGDRAEAVDISPKRRVVLPARGRGRAHPHERLAGRRLGGHRHRAVPRRVRG